MCAAIQSASLRTLGPGLRRDDGQKTKKQPKLLFFSNRCTRTHNRKRISLGGRKFLSWCEFAAFFGIPLKKRLMNLVETIGFEPTTPTMSRWCSNQLSYVSVASNYSQ
jgi:hypothetical protein